MSVNVTTRKKIRLGFDLDGVKFNFNKAWIQLARDKFGVDCPDASDSFPTDWDYMDEYLTKKQTREMWAHVSHDDLFWAKLSPYPWAFALADVGSLAVHETDGDLYFITSRMGPRVQRQCQAALMMLGFDAPNVCVVSSPKHKLPIINGLELTHFLDDKKETVQQIFDQSTCKVALWDQPWNRGVSLPRLFTVEEFEQWLM